MVTLSGFEFKRKQKELESFVPKEDDSSASVVTAGASYGTYVDIGSIASKAESDLIQRYRDISMHPDVDAAIDEIVNEFVDIEDEEIVSIDFTPETQDIIKETVINEFKETLRLLDFKNSCYETVRQWYIDGRLKYHAVIDKSNLDSGIQEIRYIDPRKIKKIREVSLKPSDNKDIPIRTVNEYYLYSEKGFGANTSAINYGATYGADFGASAVTGLKISKDSIIDVSSGIMDSNKQLVLSYLHKALKPLNQLNTLEDASIIYTLARAPERRVWYIDVGDLPPAKAEQHFNKIVQSHKNKLVYDSTTGEVKDDRKHMTMLEDYWLPRRGDNSRGTEVTTLPGGANMGEMSQVEYFRKNLYRALNIPAGRFQEGDTYAFGRSTQITRDEVKFTKFIARLRVKLSDLFLQIIEKNLLLKKLIIPEEWDLIKAQIQFKWASANYFQELKESEILNDRLNSVNAIAPHIGVFYSREWVMKRVLYMTDEEIFEMQEQILRENSNQQMTQTINNIEQSPPSADQQIGEQPGGGNEEQQTFSKEDKIHYAKQIVDQLKTKTNKTPEELRNYQSATQILVKNNRR